MPKNKISLNQRFTYVHCRGLVILMMILFFIPQLSFASSHGGIKLNVELTFGSHNTASKIGLFAFGATQDNNLAAEFGTGIWAQIHLKRFKANTAGWSVGYDAFSVVGIGDNANLLGSALSEAVDVPIFRERSSKNFIGLGAGIVDESISGSLSKFGLKRGKLILRAATKTSSLHFTFENDVRLTVIPGGASDYGQTASVDVQYTKIRNNSLTFYALDFDVFTPQPDYNLAPNNPVNSGEGLRRVWHTTSPWNKLFNANVFLTFGRVTNERTFTGKLGIDSPKFGAYTQNKIHDSFGLLPRYPWPINQKNTLFFEINANQRVQ